ncbi:MAG: FAD-dependent oxidoreductase [Pirellulales bacterium]
MQNEGDIGVSTGGPYRIAYGALVPQRGECANLLVPVCVSASHIAFGSIRMEPVFMILGQSAATAAVLAIEDDTPVQDVPYETLSARLIADGQVLTAPELEKAAAARGVDVRSLAGSAVDDDRAERTGSWTQSTSSLRYVGHGYRHDGNGGSGNSRALFSAELPQPGRYEVRLAYTPHSNRASNVPVVVSHAGGQAQVTVNQRATPPIDGTFISLGTYDFTADTEAAVTLSNKNTDGYVIIDAVQWLPVER